MANNATTLKGKRVRVTLDIPTVVEATVIADELNGVVLDVDLDTAVTTGNDADVNRGVVKHYLSRVADVDQVAYPVWLGRAHLDKVEVLG